MDNKSNEDQPGTMELPGTAGGIDWEGLRELSLRPGGFREERVSLWPKLLGVDPPAEAVGDALTSNADPHQDENQIKLDTNRSFVMYPVGVTDERDTLQEDLHELLISVFRRRRKLNYFQGYHDIASVLYLTLPPELHLVCLEKLSLHRVRDYMVSTLEPVVGLLRVTRSLLRLADPDYAIIMESNSPLPFYALSNLMTLFSHDMPTLPLIQHVFDYLLCRPPISVVYLAVTLILSRKAEALRLHEEGDEGMIHSLLNGLPEILDETPPPDPSPEVENASLDPPSDPDPGGPYGTKVPTVIPEEDPSETEGSPSEYSILHSEPQSLNTSLSLASLPEGIPSEGMGEASTSEPALPAPEDSTRPSSPSLLRSRAGRRISTLPSSRTRSSSRSMSSSGRYNRSRSSTMSSLSRRSSVSDVVPSLPHMAGLAALEDDEQLPTPVATTQARPEFDIRRPSNMKLRVPITDLLKQADELYNKFPPDHPNLKLSSIMGPQSVVFTWKEQDEENTPTERQIRDDELEAMILQADLIVYPEVPEIPEDKEEFDGDDEKGFLSNSEGTGGSQKKKRRRRKLQKPRKIDLRTKTMVAGAVIVLGVAMAVYGVRQRGGVGAVFPQAHKRWTQGKQWFGGALAGATVRYLQDSLGSGFGDGGSTAGGVGVHTDL